jgi:hypothetical protein
VPTLKSGSAPAHPRRDLCTGLFPCKITQSLISGCLVDRLYFDTRSYTYPCPKRQPPPTPISQPSVPSQPWDTQPPRDKASQSHQRNLAHLLLIQVSENGGGECSSGFQWIYRIRAWLHAVHGRNGRADEDGTKSIQQYSHPTAPER